MEIELMQGQNGFQVLDGDKQVGRIVWSLADNVMVMNGTLLEEVLRGQDYGRQLLDHAADFARANGYKMQAVCPYVVKMFERSRTYDDVNVDA